MKILFLDFDGPVIPQRSYNYNMYMKKKLDVGGLLYKFFCPSASSIVRSVLANTGAELVISSSWRRVGYDKMVEILELNNIDSVYLHDDWRTETEPDDKRANRILRWVEQHPAVTEWVAVDDEWLADDTSHGNSAIEDNFVQVNLEDGILHKHHGLMLYHLMKDELKLEKCPSWGLPRHNWVWCKSCAPLQRLFL